MAGDFESVAHDFDEAWDEEDATAPVVKIKGEMVRLPAAMPAKLVLFATRARSGADDPKRSMDVQEIVDLAGMLVGTERVQGYIDSGMSFERIAQIMRDCMGVYRKRTDGDGQGEAKAPTETGTATTSSDSSSSTGASSLPTGAVSTGPISTPS